MAQRDWNPQWWSDEDTHRWEHAKNDLLSGLAPGGPRRRNGNEGAVQNDTTRQTPFGKPPRFPANQAGSSLLGGRHQQPVNIGLGLTDDGTLHRGFTKAPITESGQSGGPKAKQGGFIPGLGEWTEHELAWRYGYELAMRYGYGAAWHFQEARWDADLERQLKSDWARSRENLPWEEIKGHVQRGFEVGRQRGR